MYMARAATGTSDTSELDIRKPVTYNRIIENIDLIKYHDQD